MTGEKKGGVAKKGGEENSCGDFDIISFNCYKTNRVARGTRLTEDLERDCRISMSERGVALI